MTSNKMLKKLFLLVCLSVTTVLSADSIGVVSASKCASESKLGKTEQSNFDNLRKQMSAYAEKTEKELGDLMSKFNDPEYMDGLSPEAALELREKIQGLNEELMRYQNQSYQVLSQASNRINQMLFAEIGVAATEVAKEQKLKLVLQQESSCFYRDDSLDVTQAVIIKMDARFEKDMKNDAAAGSQAAQ